MNKKHWNSVYKQKLWVKVVSCTCDPRQTPWYQNKIGNIYRVSNTSFPPDYIVLNTSKHHAFYMINFIDTVKVSPSIFFKIRYKISKKQ
jgi:hypothetical protein